MPQSGLIGRQNECDVLTGLLDGVRADRSGVLVLRGEAGVGKTALLDHLADAADDCRVMRSAGVESEMELAFAGLHQLCGPLLGHVRRLPEPQRDAICTAFGLVVGTVPDRFLVGLAVLSLLAETADERPLVCLIDDAQWLDQVSAQVMTFVARRLLAEPVALVFAVREPSDVGALADLPPLPLAGLHYNEARALLESTSVGRLDEQVRDRIVAETRGNPLALLGFPRGLTAAELAGGFALPSSDPLTGHIEQSYIRRVEALPIDTQRILLVAAAESVGDAVVVRQAAAQMGIPPDAVTPAELDGLIDVGLRVRFRHPLVRSAVYRSATPADRRAAHRALAAATDPTGDPDRGAWHRAHAASEPDERIAADLVASAQRARQRGGAAAAAAFLERSAELTPDSARRAERLLEAAQAKFDAVELDAAGALLSGAETQPLNGVQRARAARLRAQIVSARSRGRDAPPRLLDAARGLEPLDRQLARETYLETIAATIFAGRLSDDPGERGAAQAARAAGPGAQPAGLADLLLDALVARYTNGYAAGVPGLRRALEEFRREAARTNDRGARWLWLACPVAPEPVAPELWDDEAWHELATRAVAVARRSGELGVLPLALAYRAGVHLHAGEFESARTLIAESDSIAAATGRAPLRYISLALAGWEGDEALTQRLVAAGLRDANSRGEGRAIGLMGYVDAVLYNGLGRYPEALAGAALAGEHDDLGFYGWALVEAVEAGVRSGSPDAAARALRQLEERTTAAGTDWALGMLARSQALTTSGPAAETLYRDALDRLGRSRIVVHLARAHLVYGEWLRRENRRIDAREQLRVAHGMFDQMGARAFADRTRRELVATGETTRVRVVATHDRLTPQERQIARLAADGHTNPEIGGQLFISPRTVEYHLSKVFTKLSIRTRRDLPVALAHG